jgi:hypothetical protein
MDDQTSSKIGNILEKILEKVVINPKSSLTSNQVISYSEFERAKLEKKDQLVKMKEVDLE